MISDYFLCVLLIFFLTFPLVWPIAIRDARCRARAESPEWVVAIMGHGLAATPTPPPTATTSDLHSHLHLNQQEQQLLVPTARRCSPAPRCSPPAAPRCCQWLAPRRRTCTATGTAGSRRRGVAIATQRATTRAWVPAATMDAPPPRSAPPCVPRRNLPSGSI